MCPHDQGNSVAPGRVAHDVLVPGEGPELDEPHHPYDLAPYAHLLSAEEAFSCSLGRGACVASWAADEGMCLDKPPGFGNLAVFVS